MELLVRTLGIGLASAAVQLPFALWIGRWMLRREFPGRSIVQSILVLPMFLPPVAVGLLLLMLLGPQGPLGGVLAGILYTEIAAILAATVVAFPLMLRHVQEALEAVPERLGQVSRTWARVPGRPLSGWSCPWRVVAWPSGCSLPLRGESPSTGRRR